MVLRRISLKAATGTLRNKLIFWFLIFSLVPVGFVTGFSLQKSRAALDKELFQRVQGNTREIEVTLRDMEKLVNTRAEKLSQDRAFAFYVSTTQEASLKSALTDWLNSSIATRVSVIESDGRMAASVFKDSTGVARAEDFSKDKSIYISEVVVKQLKEKPKLKLVDSQKGKLELISYYPVSSKADRIVGYLEVVMSLDKSFMDNFKSRIGAEMALMNEEFKVAVATHDDITLYSKEFFQGLKGDYLNKLFDINIRGEPYGFLVYPSSWGDTKVFVILAASKSEANKTISNIKTAFVGVLIAIIFLVLVLIWIASNVVVRPLRELYEGIRRMNQGESGVEVAVRGDNEMTYLSASFNEMTGKIKRAQDELKKKIQELEKANLEIKSTQVQLVHSAKMASLGQLVAGVAHELNNPIGFIYSNMAQLDEYSQKLMGIIENKSEKDTDYDYIRQDMPKLIKSCQDGARRTRDIVVGLRNFSRLEEAVLKEADINAALDDTLNLLSGEMKNRINVKKNYGKIPMVLCYASNLNQVFMNILSNAAHAIKDEGDITLKTSVTKEGGEQFVLISIKDSGQGMTKDVKEKIFEPFFSTKGVGQGTGLGMSISYGIIKKHGGEIEVVSEPKKGAEFIIKLPVMGPPDKRN
jgi:two-component system, NtrC family, sensor kinase